MLSIPADLPDLKSFTKSFLFYPFVMDHADQLGLIIGNESTWTQGYLDGAQMPKNLHDAKALIAIWMLPNPTYTVLSNDESRTVIGAVNIVETNEKECSARLGNLVISPQHWTIDKRLEIMGTLLDYLFERGAQRIEAREAQNNTPALDVLHRLGFQQEGVRRNSVQRHDGVWQDRMVLSITPADWAGHRERIYQQITDFRSK